MGTFHMPSLGADMEAGKLVEWLVRPGDEVKRGDIIAVVETQKGAIEIEVFEDGRFEQPLVKLGDTVPVGTPIAVIRGDCEEEPAAEEPSKPAKATAEKPVAEAARPAPAQAAIPSGAPAPVGLRISPAARRLAAESGIDASALTGSGPEGAVVCADVEAAMGTKAAAPTARPAPAKAAGFDPEQMRAAIAAAMARSKREIPHYYLQDTIDLTAAGNWLARINSGRSPAERLLLGALFVKATAVAAKKYPEFSGFHGKSGFEPAQRTHIGVAISIRGGGLVAPAIHDTADLSLDEVMAGMRDLVGRVRAGRFRSSELSDPTLTVSSLGDRGVEALYGVIYPPQVAIVGFGRADERPWVIDGAVVPRLLVTATLAADHRVSDGHRGALFLAHIGKLLQQPEAL
jgi:pyruvate dehydrogenase E2 component (dihydrolipoamide acetyltransferase)